MPSKAKSDFRMEKDLQALMVKVMEAEQRSKMLTELAKGGVATRDVAKNARNQVKSRKVKKSGNYNEIVEFEMGKKLKDSKNDENILRVRRKKKRKELEKILDPRSKKYQNMMERLTRKRLNRMHMVKAKNREKVKNLKKEHEQISKENSPSSCLPEECRKYENLRLFRETDIKPEPPKPPVIVGEIILSEEEISVLAKGPKFTLRNILDKGNYLEEVEKAYIKEKYNRIGKTEKDGIVLEERDKDSEWLDKKQSLIYDFEEKNINFGRAKPTGWKGNKRVTLPKGGSAQLEGFLEVRRRQAVKIYDACLKILGQDEDGDRVKLENLTAKDRRGLESLKRRVKEKEIIVCRTDKSGRFAVLSREQYIKAGEAHTDKDLEVELEEAEEIQRVLNGHMRWWAKSLNLAGDWDQEDRALRNLLNHGLSICPMTILVKDHKSWSVDVKSRPVMNGKVGMNTNMSEFLSLFLEPVANEDKRNMEVNASDGLIVDIEGVNKKWSSIRQEAETSTPQEENCHHHHQTGGNVADPPEREVGSGTSQKDEVLENNEDVEPKDNSEVENIPEERKEPLGEENTSTPLEGDHHHQQVGESMADPPEREVGSGTFQKDGVKKDDIRFYITREASILKDTLRTSEKILPATTKKESKMEMLRRKMMECREKKET